MFFNSELLSIIVSIIYFVVSFGGLLPVNEEYLNTIEAKRNINFENISAEEMQITSDENELCEKWFNENFSLLKETYPFTFKIDGKKFNPDEWIKSYDNSAAFGSVYAGGQTNYFTFTNTEENLNVTVEATVFSNNATCQWTVYIKNTGTENSGVISDFYALNSAFSTGQTKLYYSMGSNTAASDFSLIEKKLSLMKKTFSGTDGKPTEKYLPYFNICGENFNAVLGIGWTGQWEAVFSEFNNKTNITVKQESLKAYLLPDEEIRSPLVSLSFYNNSNPLKGFNLFRKWVMDCVYPENITQDYYTAMEVAGAFSTRTSDEIIALLDGIEDWVFDEIDCFWMDAGWYTYNESWYDGVGNWIADISRYDNGISELSDYAKSNGIGHLLWYEPERVRVGTEFYNVGIQHEKWLIYSSGDDMMWNLADEEALEYYCEYILNSLCENGVTIYRQDFNFAPLEYLQEADKEYYDGRKGICENHYVTNMYRFLDYLCENIDGLIIDNCASGGKRLDLEMTYRSIPFWRSDYNCGFPSDLFEATQSHTYGISFWLPISGTALNQTNEFSVRSAVIPLIFMDIFAWTNPLYELYEEQRELMTGNYYPLDFGSYAKNRIHAMQFSSDDSLSGTAFIYKRADVKEAEYTVSLNGLSADAIYNVYDIDAPDIVYTLSGDELMNDGIVLKLPEGEKAIILMYCII